MKLISVIGPTAIGKTSFAIELAKHYNTEIISSDSRQFYREMEIGTAKPSKEELASVPHHFINSLSIFSDYSVGQYEKDALHTLEDLFQKYNTVIMVGGSPLYEKAVIEGLDDFPEIDPEIRTRLIALQKEKGIEELQQMLQKHDAEYYQEVDLQNAHRLIRALEISIGTGKPYSSFKNANKKNRKFTVQRIGLEADRQWVYDRINRRVDIMREEGLLQEAKDLYQYKDLNALQTVGYKELFQYFDGDFTEDQAFEEIKKNSRRFAKRQLTWYRNDDSIQWIPVNELALFLENLTT